jgi:hypothetical protein
LCVHPFLQLLLFDLPPVGGQDGEPLMAA